MEFVGKLETMFAPFYGRLPHLPEKARQWIANNSWWIILVSVIFMALGLLSVLGVLLVGTMLLSVLAGVYGAVLGTIVAILTLLWMVLYVVDIVFMAMAIAPLKAHQAHGWRLLLAVLLIGAAVEVTYVFVSGNVGSFIGSMAGTALAGYVLFEIRDYFVEAGDVSQVKRTESAPPAFTPTKEDKSADHGA